MNIYPKVFKSHMTAKVNFEITASETDRVEVKIQSMEEYSINHTPKYRIDEENRYPYASPTKVSDNLYSLDYDFLQEQRYSVRVKVNGTVIAYDNLYAVDEDLFSLTPYKGDTHLHTCRSDGEDTPFQVCCSYREKGYDFIAITDHHKYAPSIEGRTEISALTKAFTVFPGEEVHNKDMGYFHIVNFNGSRSVNEIIETDDEFVESELERIMEERNFTSADPKTLAYRVFISEQIRSSGGLAILTHPFWDVFGEYHTPLSDCIYHIKNGDFDALEVFAGCGDTKNYGNNLQVALWTELISEGYRIPVLGASDSHSRTNERSLFNKQYSIVFAPTPEQIPHAVKNDYSVAVLAQADSKYFCVGKFRLVKYARFLLDEYFAPYANLTALHAKALASKSESEINATEKTLAKFYNQFFGK